MSQGSRTSFLMTLIMAVSLTACTSDYLDMSTLFRSELCVVQNSTGSSISLLTDNGRLLNPNSEMDTDTYKPGSRYMVTYIIVDSTSQSLSGPDSYSYSVSVKELQEVLVKPILRPEELTTPIVNEDPIRLLSQPWLGGGFLNLEFMLRYENPNIKHAWLMLVDTTRTENGSLNTYLTFFHDALGDGQVKTASTLVSFDCANLPYREQSDSLIIRVFEWDANNQLNHRQLRIKNTAKIE